MVKDPVCHMNVDEKTAPWSSTYRGKTYYFSSETCKADFDRNPEGYFNATGRLTSRARSQIQSMIGEQKETAAQKIVMVSDVIRGVAQKLREQNQAATAGYADNAAEKVDRLSEYLRQRDAEQIINETENFIRRQPGLVIGTAVVAGFLAARFLKSSRSMSA